MRYTQRQELERSNQPTYSVGLDPSLSGFGVVCRPINHEEWYGCTFSSTAKDGSDEARAVQLAREVTDILVDLPYLPAFVCFEDYGPIGRTSGKITARAEMCGIVKAFCLVGLRIPIIMITPNALKSFACPNRKGKGFASKEEMVLTAHRQGYYAQTDDEADAYFAAQVGATLFHGDKVGTSYRRVNPE